MNQKNIVACVVINSAFFVIFQKKNGAYKVSSAKTVGMCKKTNEKKIWTTPTTTAPVGGLIVPLDMTSLFVAGITTNTVWILPTLGGIAGAAISFFKIKRK